MKTLAISRLAWRLCLVILLWSGVAMCLWGEATTNILVPAGSMWKYLDDGSDPGTTWRGLAYDDSAWPSGFAQLGFGDFDEETTLERGPTGNQFITYYFRQTFVLSGLSSYTSFTLGVLRDDGVVVYVNGTNVWRNNMPAGAIGFRTLASSNVTGAAEETFYSTNLPPKVFRKGTNLIAVEVHQAAITSGDLSFDLQLSGISVPPLVTRGPYLQQGSTTNLVVRWRTDLPGDSEVRYGADPAFLDSVASDATGTIEHEVTLTGLLPNTRYYYSIGTTEQALAGDESYHFITAPDAGKPTRIWVQGDSGTADPNARSVYEAYRDFNGGRYTDLWLMLGDNAYGAGTDQEYQAAVFNMFPDLLRQTVLWSTIGNHETYSASFTDFPYLHIFSLPQHGEAGGLPSGTERYYSFNYGNIHFVCLDAMTSIRSASGPMATWLAEDLQANTNDWLIAFWHHPPYTKGSHDSDLEPELVEMRENMVPILESYGVDLVLSGHSHSYERSFFMNGHYGPSGSFGEGMKKDSGNGRENGTGPYIKMDLGPGANQGTVYVVAGSSGQLSFGALNHPAMYFAELRFGSLVIDIDGPTLRCKFLRETGQIDDEFTIIKGPQTNAVRLVAHPVANGVLTISWNSVTGRNYIIERATSLGSPDWLEISGELPGSGGTMSWEIPVGSPPSGAFFRVRIQPD